MASSSLSSQLRYSPLSSSPRQFSPFSSNRLSSPNSFSYPLNQTTNLRLSSSSDNLPHLCFASNGGDGGAGFIGGNGGGKGGNWNSGDGGDSFSESNDGNESSSFWENIGLIGIFIKGWKSRVLADPQFPFKVLMEELVGVTSCVIGDMASRPNFGLNELDFVFSTLGAIFAAVGFAAGLVGTAMSNGLIAIKKKMDPGFETPNKAPPTLLNAVTWALHMGLSSNLRYQTLNGVEFLLAKAASPVVFKSSVVVLRCLNNVLGGMSFVVLARMTGSQSVTPTAAAVGSGLDDGEEKEKEKLVAN
uniref:Uncharacterized protein n=1 Tax=Chenopodium quinoa TaxID=63459 RepID=A0A803L432_CHEQI